MKIPIHLRAAAELELRRRHKDKVIIVSFVEPNGEVDRDDIREDHPECPGYEKQLEAERENLQQGAIAIVYCHSDCGRQCRAK